MSDYRVPAPRCPACVEPLETFAVGDALVDHCRACGGLFLDWFDGEPRAIASSLVAPVDDVWVGPEPARLAGACPRCAVRLDVELFEGRGPYVHRCSACAGVFVDEASVRLLASTRVPDPTSPAPAGPVASFVAALRGALRALSGSSTED